MITPQEAEKRRLARLDSPARIKWLRERVQDYAVEMGARTYFRLPTTVCGYPIDDPKAEIVAACVGIGNHHDLTGAECAAAFKAEWAAALSLAERVGEKLKIAGLSHIKAAGSARGIEAALQATVAKFPQNWPHLTRDDIASIAAGFQRPMKSRRAT